MKILILLLFLILSVKEGFASDTVSVSIDTCRKHQIIMGWGAFISIPSWMPEPTKNDVFTEAVFDLGITRLRMEPPAGNSSGSKRWEWFNDNWNPYDTRQEAFNTKDLDIYVKKVILPFKKLVESRGEKFSLCITPSFFDFGNSGNIPVWLFKSPGEYAEYAVTILRHLKDTFNIEPDYYSVIDKPGYYNPFNSSSLSSTIKVLGQAIEKAGFKTKIQFPDAYSPQKTWDYINNLRDDKDLWKYVGLLSYQLYGKSDPYRSYISRFADSLAIPSAQSEYYGLKIHDLYEDMTLGNVSFWNTYGLSNNLPYNYNRIFHASEYWRLRQVMHFVQPGSVRVDANSDSESVSPLAYIKNGRATLVLIGDTVDKVVNVHGLPKGKYGTSIALRSPFYRETGVVDIDSDSLTVSLPADAVITYYPYEGKNLPPVPVSWYPGSEYLTLPDSSVDLNIVATDPELDSLRYLWSIEKKPAGAKVTIKNFKSANASADNLTVPGDYVFSINISDGINQVIKRVRVSVFGDNQPPAPQDFYNQIPVVITLPADSTYLAAYAWDMERDRLDYSINIINQPVGADAQITKLSKGYGWKMNNMNVAGDYLLDLTVTDSMHIVHDTLNVPVYPINENAPDIESITASKDTLFLPESSLTLSAVTSDKDGDGITHWWSVISAPDSARPVLETPGLAQTVASNLNVPGYYRFLLYAIDRTLYSYKDVTVVVVDPTSINDKTAQPGYISVNPNPASDHCILSFRLNKPGTIKLTIADNLGREIATLADGWYQQGDYTRIFDTRDIPTGVYFYNLQAGECSFNGKIVVIK